MILVVWLVLALFSDAFGQSQIFNSPGAQTFEVPAGVTSVTVEVWGGGGRGGTRTNNGGGAGGGGGGAYSHSTINVVPGQLINLFVGSGSPTTSPGQDSWFLNSTTVMAKGGNSVANNSATGATGGSAANGFGDIKYSGGNGYTVLPGNSFGGGGGSSAGTGQIGAQATGRTGAIAPSGGGNGAAGSLGVNGAGNPAITIGGGGGGAFKSTGPTDRIGGNGGNGQVRISYFTINLTSGQSTVNQTKCIGVPIEAITYEVTGVNGITPSLFPPWLSATFSGDISSGIINISGTPSASAGVFPFEIILQGNFSTTTLEGSIRVPQDNAFDLISQDEFCLGSPLNNVTQATFRATGIGTPINLPPGIDASWNAGQIEFTGIPTVTGEWSYSIPLTGGCGTVSATGTLRVNNVLAVNSPQLGAQSQCVGTPFTALSVDPGFGFSYQWFENNLENNTTGTPIPLANSNTYTPSSATAGTAKYYYVEITGFCGGSEVSNPSGLIETLVGNTVTPASSSPVVCISTAIPTITHTTTGATGILNGGMSGVNGLPSGVSATWLGNTITITGSPTASGTFNYNIPLIGGCGTVSATGTITVTPQASILTPSLGAQARCENGANGFNPISVGTRPGWTYQWFSNTIASNTGGTAIADANFNTFTPPSNVEGYYYVVVTSPTCGTTATSAVSGLFKVNPPPVVSFISQPSGTGCVDANYTYTTQSGFSNYAWTIPGVTNTDYTIVSGANTNAITIRWLSPGSKSVSVNYRNPNGCSASTPTISNPITIQKNTVTAPLIPLSACSDGTFNDINLTTTGATGIANNGISGANGLPLGLNATWSGGIITISGTVDPSVAPGNYVYNIPLTGGCGTVFATGSVEVQSAYQLNSTTSIAPSASGGVARITITGNPSILTNGTYEVTYELGLANSALGINTANVNVASGKGIFSTVAIPNDQLTSLIITSIRKLNVSTNCVIPINSNNQTFFGFGDLPFPDGGIFYVPAGITEITLKVWGGGGGGGRNNGGGGGGSGYSIVTLSVIPGSMLYLYVGNGGAGATNSGTAQNGQPSYVSRTPNPANPATSSVAYASGGFAANGQTGGAGGAGNNALGSSGVNGTTVAGKGGNGGAPGSSGGLAGAPMNGDGVGGTLGGGGGGAAGNGDGGAGGRGLIVISYPLPPVSQCFVVLDDGARSGATIIEFTCSTVWQAPEGLIEFTVTTVGGGGGGGMGKAAGGGGAGGFAQSTVTSNGTYGLPANETNFNVTVGQGGLGALNESARGGPGGGSSVTGTVDGSPIIIAPTAGGGGGGSTNSINGGAGESGASGGGGAYDGNVNGLDTRNNGGNGSTGFSGGGVEKKTFANDITKGAAAGGGGGGAAGPGTTGAASGAGNADGGNGGAGLSYTLSLGGTLYYNGGGGGGNGFNFEGNSTKQAPGDGGTFSGIPLGGKGSVDGVGGNGVTRTGSGGGSGVFGGGNGGTGRVFITYEVFRILPIEYLYFNAIYQRSDRSGELKWATAKEWENSHFEIERSVNDTRNWTKVGEVYGQGYSDVPVEYSFIDLNLPASGGNIFYRLKQVDLNGDFAYGLTKAIQVEALDGTTSWIAYPNPSAMRSSISVDLLDRSGYADESILVRISDARGILESYSVSSPDEVSSVVNSYLEQARPGLHILQLIWGSKSEQIKLIRK